MSGVEINTPDYESWGGYTSRASLIVQDGPMDETDWIAPLEPPPPGDPAIYSLDPDAFTAAVGIQPTKILRRGDRKRNGRYRTRNVWRLGTNLPPDAAPHEHVKALLNRLGVNLERFREITTAYQVTMQVVSFGTNPGLCLDPADVLRLAEIRAGLDVDMYPASNEAEEQLQ